MSRAGFEATIEVSTDDSSYNDVGGTTNTGFNITIGEVDTTELGDDAMDRIGGLFDSGVPLSVRYDPTDTGQAAIQAAALARTPLYFRYRLYENGPGFKVQARIFGLNIGSQAGNETTNLEVTVKGIATPSVVAAV